MALGPEDDNEKPDYRSNSRTDASLEYENKYKDIYERIIATQQSDQNWADMPPHEPEIFYIGCSDARLDPIRHLRIPQGKMFIWRNIGGRVPKMPDMDAMSREEAKSREAARNGQIPEGVAFGAALEFFMNIKLPPGADGKPRKKHIIVAGHTDCGGIRGCVSHDHGHDHDKTDSNKKHSYLSYYLDAMKAPLESALKALLGGPEKDVRRGMEEESIRQSLKNLDGYLAHLKEHELLKNGDDVEVHGWLLETGKKRDIWEMHKDTGAFNPLRNRPEGLGGEEIARR